MRSERCRLRSSLSRYVQQEINARLGVHREPRNRDMIRMTMPTVRIVGHHNLRRMPSNDRNQLIPNDLRWRIGETLVAVPKEMNVADAEETCRFAQLGLAQGRQKSSSAQRGGSPRDPASPCVAVTSLDVRLVAGGIGARVGAVRSRRWWDLGTIRGRQAGTEHRRIRDGRDRRSSQNSHNECAAGNPPNLTGGFRST